MNELIIALGDERVTAVLGARGKSPNVKKLYRAPIKDSTVNEIGTALNTLFAAHSLPKGNVTLSLSSSVASVKLIRAPKMPKNKLRMLVRHEMQTSENKEMISDYLVMSREKDSSYVLLGVACPKRILDEYLGMLKEFGIKPKVINSALAGQIKLLYTYPEFKNNYSIVMIFENSSVTSIMLEKGVYKYSSKLRIFSDPGTLDFATEVTRNVSGTLQFQASTRSEFPITSIYYAGCPDDDFSVCIPGIAELGLKVQRLPEPPCVRNSCGSTLSDYTDCIGAMLK